MIKYIFIIFFIPSIVFAEIENARDLMEEGKFKEAMEELMPAARSGNADAEELIGIMYAMGLGVERDDVRAFEWYLRSSMKGHPGAQSGRREKGRWRASGADRHHCTAPTWPEACHSYQEALCTGQG